MRSVILKEGFSSKFLVTVQTVPCTWLQFVSGKMDGMCMNVFVIKKIAKVKEWGTNGFATPSIYIFVSAEKPAILQIFLLNYIC